MQTTLGTIEAFDAETGRTLWATRVGSSKHATSAPGANKKFVCVTNGVRLFCIRRDTGAIAWEEKLVGAPSAGCAVSEDHVWVPLDSGALEQYKLVRDDSLDRAPITRFGSRSAVSAPIIADKQVAWTTLRGDFFADDMESRQNRVQVRTMGPIVAQPTYWPPLYYVTSRDGDLYALRAVNGAIEWHYSTASPISNSPTVVADAVYLIADSGRLRRLSPTSGVMQWMVENQDQLLAVSKSRVYTCDMVGRLNVFDAASGSRLATLPIEFLNVRLTNQKTDRIYLLNKEGLIVCLRELDAVKPLLHTPPPPPDPSKKPAKKAEDGEAPAEPGAPAANPFG